MRPGPLAAAVLVCLVPPAAADWTRARSPLVEVLTETSPAYARAAAEHVGAFDRVLRSALPGLPAPAADATPPLVLAVAGEAALARLLPVHVGEPGRVDGVILGGADRTYIAVDVVARPEEPFEPLAHEYAHFVLNAALPAQPAWLGEGLATLLAAAVPGPGVVTLGAPVAGHLQRLRAGPPMPLADLLDVGYTSPTYLGRRGRDEFYARSWLLAHWVVAGGHGGMDGLLAYARAIADGESPGAAFPRCFGTTVAAADAALGAYAAGPLPAVTVPMAAAREAPVELSAPDARDVAPHVAEVLLRGGRVAEARGVLARATESAAPTPAVHEGLAAVALREGKLADARRHLHSALAGAPEHPRALLRRAEILLREVSARGDVPTDAETDRAVAWLSRATDADPDLADAADLLARLRPAPLPHRIGLLRRAVARNPERAELAFTLAGLHIRRNDLAEAARVLRRARERTRDESHRFLAGHLLSRIGATETREARGVLEEVECLAGGALAFRVRTAAGAVRLAASSARAVLLFDADGETYEREFTCGPASAAVTARYRPPAAGADPAIVSLSFEDR